MAKKKTSKRTKKYAGKTEKEWRDWGEEFGKTMEKVGEDFGKHMEGRGKQLEKKCKGWWFYTFGFIGPLISSIIGILFLVIAIWFLNFANIHLFNSFISMLSDFLFSNIQFFFLASLFFGYCKYFSMRYEKNYWTVSPIVNGLNAIFVIWILVSMFIMVGAYTMTDIITNFSAFILRILWILFALFTLIGYLSEFAKVSFKYRNAKTSIFKKPKNF